MLDKVARVVFLAAVMSTANAFVAPGAAFARHTTRLNDSDRGAVEQIEFKIFPDGRVEETVRGIRGNNCHKVTEKINEALGEVISSEPTEDMFEQDLVIEQTVEESEGGTELGGNWGSTW